MFNLFKLSKLANQTGAEEIKVDDIKYETKSEINKNEENIYSDMPKLEPVNNNNINNNNNNSIVLEHAVLYDSKGREFDFKDPGADTCTFRHGVSFLFRCKDDDYRVIRGVIPYYSPNLCDYNVTLNEFVDTKNTKYISINKIYTIEKLDVVPFLFTMHTCDKIMKTIGEIYDADPNVVFNGLMSYQVYCMTQAWSNYRNLHDYVPKTALEWILQENKIEMKLMEKPNTTYKPWTPFLLNSAVLCGYWILLDCPLLFKYFPLNALTPLEFREIRNLHTYITETCTDMSDLFLKPIPVSDTKKISPVSFVYVLSSNHGLEHVARDIFRKIVDHYDEHGYTMMLCIWLFDALYQDIVLSKGHTIHKCSTQDSTILWWNKFTKWGGPALGNTESEFGQCHNLGKRMLQLLFPKHTVPNLNDGKITPRLVPDLVDMGSLVLIEQKNPKTQNLESFIAIQTRYNKARAACEFLVQFRDKPDPKKPSSVIPTFIKPIDKYDYISFDKEQRLAAHLVETSDGHVHFWSGNGGKIYSYILLLLLLFFLIFQAILTNCMYLCIKIFCNIYRQW